MDTQAGSLRRVAAAPIWRWWPRPS